MLSSKPPSYGYSSFTPSGPAPLAPFSYDKQRQDGVRRVVMTAPNLLAPTDGYCARPAEKIANVAAKTVGEKAVPSPYVLHEPPQTPGVTIMPTPGLVGENCIEVMIDSPNVVQLHSVGLEMASPVVVGNRDGGWSCNMLTTMKPNKVPLIVTRKKKSLCC